MTQAKRKLPEEVHAAGNSYQPLEEARLANVPNELQTGKRFVCWREEIRNGKRTKVPINPYTGRKAESDDPRTWSTLDEAMEFYHKHPNEIKGVGRMFDGADGVLGLDFDDCLDEHGNFIVGHVAEKWLSRLDSYSEVSPSGWGVKVWVHASLDLDGKTGRRDAKQGVEIYRERRYFTITGQRLAQFSDKVENRQSEVDEFYAEIFGPKEPATAEPVTSTITTFFDAEIISRASNAKNGDKFKALWAGSADGYESESEADAALCSLLWFWTGDRDAVRRLFGQSGLGQREKWQRPGYQETTLDLTCRGEVYSLLQNEAASALPSAKSDIVWTPLGELLSRPVVPVDWVWEGRLVAGSLSIVASKPKVGKSTFARNLAMSVARGVPFLGLPVKRGTVFYLALEERHEDVAADFRAMGADGSEDIQLAEAAQVLDVVTILLERKPVLLVIDPLFRLLTVRDEKGYAEMYAALGPLIDVARKTGTLVLCLHHSPKMAKTDAIDAPIGSTALGGAVSTLVVLGRTESYRTICSVQRVGKNLPETVLHFDARTKGLSMGGSREIAEVASVGEAILSAIGEKIMTEMEIGDGVESKTAHKRKALRELTARGKIIRSGSGKKGEPFHYQNARFVVPAPIENIGDKHSGDRGEEQLAEREEIPVPTDIRYIGNKETSISNTPGTVEDIGQMVVPGRNGQPKLSETCGNNNSAEVRI